MCVCVCVCSGGNEGGEEKPAVAAAPGLAMPAGMPMMPGMIPMMPGMPGVMPGEYLSLSVCVYVYRACKCYVTA